MTTKKRTAASDAATIPLFGDAQPASPAPALPDNGSATSRAAAERAAPARMTGQARVLDHVRRCGKYGATREEVARHTRMKVNTVNARTNDLLRRVDRKTGKDITPPIAEVGTRNGCAILVAVEHIPAGAVPRLSNRRPEDAALLARKALPAVSSAPPDAPAGVMVYEVTAESPGAAPLARAMRDALNDAGDTVRVARHMEA